MSSAQQVHPALQGGESNLGSGALSSANCQQPRLCPAYNVWPATQSVGLVCQRSVHPAMQLAAVTLSKRNSGNTKRRRTNWPELCRRLGLDVRVAQTFLSRKSSWQITVKGQSCVGRQLLASGRQIFMVVWQSRHRPGKWPVPSAAANYKTADYKIGSYKRKQQLPHCSAGGSR